MSYPCQVYAIYPYDEKGQEVANKVGLSPTSFNQRLDGLYEFSNQQMEALKSIFPNVSPEVIESFIARKAET